MILMSWIFFSCVTQSMFSSHLDMTLSSITNVRSSAWWWVWCSPELVTFSFNGCCSLWCSPANIVIIMIINLHNKAWFSSVVWKSSSELSRLWSANFKREQDGKGGMKVGEEYVSYRKCDVILLEHFMSHWPQCKTITITITTQSNENRLLGSSDDWYGIAWDLVEQENGEALLQQFRGCCEQVTNGCGQQVFLKYSVTCFQKSEVPPLVILFFLTRLSGPSVHRLKLIFIKKTGCSDEISFNVFVRVGKVLWETSVLKCLRAKMFKCKIL